MVKPVFTTTPDPRRGNRLRRASLFISEFTGVSERPAATILMPSLETFKQHLCLRTFSRQTYAMLLGEEKARLVIGALFFEA